MICQTCGKSFYVKPCREITAKFCSIKCKGEWMGKNQRGKDNPHWHGGKEKKECLHCKKSFHVIQYRRNTAKFCSEKCMGKYWRKENSPHWKGGKLLYVPNYTKLKTIVLKRGNYTCGLCSSTYNIELHHIYPQTKYPELTYNMDNIILLCYNCHMYFKQREESFIDFFERFREWRL